MEKDYLTRLQNWYQSNCNGDWEHSFGVKLDTLDNPGWHIELNLEDTCLENAEISISEDNGEDDWYIINTKDNKFIGDGDFSKLNKIFEIFFDELLAKKKNDNFLYELFLPVSDINDMIYRPVHASMVNENIFEIKKINSISEEKKNIQFINIEDIGELNFDDIEEDIKYHINDFVNCELKRFYNRLGLLISNKIEKTS